MEAFNEIESSRVLSTALSLIALYFLALILQRLVFSPIKNFPGPKLAALTFWYEAYYDVVLGGKYTFKIRDLHAKYGPIVRINPKEIHISTPSFYDTLYAGPGGGKRDKWDYYTHQFTTPGATFSTVNHDHHRVRRAALSPFFSMANVRRLQPLLEDRVGVLVQRLREFRDGNNVLTIDVAYSAFTNDVVMEYSLAQSKNRLAAKDFAPDYHDALEAAAKGGALVKQLPFIVTIMRSLPNSVASMLMPKMASAINARRDAFKQVAEVKAESKPRNKDVEHKTIFHELLASKLADSEKTNVRLAEEATILVGAGTGTTAWALSVATFHLLKDPAMLTKLKLELEAAIPDANVAPPLVVLQNLPYLAAVIQEALRLSYGTSSRLERVLPNDTLVFNDGSQDWAIPAGTPVSMTSTLIHHDESIFPSSDSFKPERWIQDPRLDRYLISFSKGTRQCLGMNLAYAEMYICLSAIFRKFGSTDGTKEVRTKGDEGVMSLWETGLEDVVLDIDGFTAFPRAESKGVRVRIKL